MHKIIFISTVHKENGKCNAAELCSIIRKISPEIIFLEALDESYSEYDKSRFIDFGVFHNKLEIAAIQKYCHYASFKYIPVLDNPMSASFEKKYNSICENIEFKKLVDNFSYLAREGGFRFLNSEVSIKLQEEMRILERCLLNDSQLNDKAVAAIDEYEKSMIGNIYSYCNKNHFNEAIFLCGVAHRQSIIEKVNKIGNQEEKKLNWFFF